MHQFVTATNDDGFWLADDIAAGRTTDNAL